MPDSSQNKLKFTQKTDRLISDAASFKITFSKPKHQNKEVIPKNLKKNYKKCIY